MTLLNKMIEYLKSEKKEDFVLTLDRKSVENLVERLSIAFNCVLGLSKVLFKELDSVPVKEDKPKQEEKK